MIPLSVIVITRNEERNIVACLDSVKWADDLIVVDAQSNDATLALARQFTQKVFVEPWKGFADAKEFAVSKSRHEWILWLDADERVTPELASEIQALLTSSDLKDAYTVARRAYFLGRWIKHSGWYPGRVARLFRKDRASFSSAAVHEGLIIQGTVGELQHDLLHFTDPNLYHYLAKFNRYTSLASKESYDAGKSFRLIDLFVRPPWIFVKMFVLRLGFLDGLPGLLLALLSSSYVFTKYAKLWEAWTSSSS
jgi:glycosyltransferase involved in cell wall biosynthesis